MDEPRARRRRAADTSVDTALHCVMSDMAQLVTNLERLGAMKEKGQLSSAQFETAKERLLALDPDATTDTGIDGQIAAEAEAEHDGAASAQEAATVGAIPSFWRRHLRMTPAFEAFVPKDHLPSFRSHWIESKRHDGFALKEAMVMLYESELLVGALLLSTFTSMMFSGTIAQSQLDDFRAGKIGTLGFFTVAIGAFCCIMSFMYLFTSYIAIMLILPISEANIYAFLKLPSTLRSLNVVNFMLVLSAFGGLQFVFLVLISATSGSWIMVGICGGSMIAFASTLFWTFSHSFNLSMLGGFYGAKGVVDPATAERLSGKELEELLVRPVLDYREEHGSTDPPASEWYEDRGLPAGNSNGRDGKVLSARVLPGVARQMGRRTSKNTHIAAWT